MGSACRCCWPPDASLARAALDRPEIPAGPAAAAWADTAPAAAARPAAADKSPAAVAAAGAARPAAAARRKRRRHRNWRRHGRRRRRRRRRRIGCSRYDGAGGAAGGAGMGGGGGTLTTCMSGRADAASSTNFPFPQHRASKLHPPGDLRRQRRRHRLAEVQGQVHRRRRRRRGQQRQPEGARRTDRHQHCLRGVAYGMLFAVYMNDKTTSTSSGSTSTPTWTRPAS